MNDLVQWLREQLDEDERTARAATPGPWEQSGIGEYGWGVSFSRMGAGVEAEDSDQGRADADHIAAWDPARVLREIDAKRGIIREWEDAQRTAEQDSADVSARVAMLAFEIVLKLEARVYADRPGYEESWRP